MEEKTLKELIKESGLSISEFARRSQMTVPQAFRIISEGRQAKVRSHTISCIYKSIGAKAEDYLDIYK